jgi:hypothetical protein
MLEIEARALPVPGNTATPPGLRNFFFLVFHSHEGSLLDIINFIKIF